MRHGRILAKLLRKNLPAEIRGAEIGVFRGQTSAYLLEQLPSLRLVMIDSWQSHSPDSRYYRSGANCARLTMEQQQRNYLTAIDATRSFADRRQIINLPSLSAAREIQDGTLDFVFIDADHTYEAVRDDIAAWSTKLRPGGLLIGHDYGARLDVKGYWGVKKAVDEYCESRSLSLRVERYAVWWTIWSISPSQELSAVIADRPFVSQLAVRECLAPLASEWPLGR